MTRPDGFVDETEANRSRLTGRLVAVVGLVAVGGCFALNAVLVERDYWLPLAFGLAVLYALPITLVVAVSGRLVLALTKGDWRAWRIASSVLPGWIAGTLGVRWLVVPGDWSAGDVAAVLVISMAAAAVTAFAMTLRR